MNEKLYEMLETGKFIIGLILIVVGYFSNVNQIVIGLGAFLIAMSGEEIKIGKLMIFPSFRK